MNLHLDFETRSQVDLKKCGLHAYAEDPSTEILCASYAVDDGPVQSWWPDANLALPFFARMLDEADTITAHNAQFERIILRDVGKKYGLPARPIEAFRCTMIMAYALGLPGKLDDAAHAVGLNYRKDQAGARTMLKMCKPRKPTKHEMPGLYWHDKPEDHERLRAYCAQDVEVERALEKRLLPLSKDELALWFLDQEINDRGIAVDAELAEGAVKIVERITSELNARMRRVSGSEVCSITDRLGIIRFAKSQGFPDIESIAKDRLVAILIRDDLTPALRECLEIRQEGAKASAAKAEALLRGRCADGRVRGLLQFNAANTRRWGGRRFQPQNLKRPQTSKKWIPSMIDSVRRGEWSPTDELFYGPALSAIGDVTRGMIQAEDGKQLTAADYSNIEGRVLAWLAGEETTLKAFRAYDTILPGYDEKGDPLRAGPDLYKITASGITGIPIADITEALRQAMGKVPDLAMGYQGGVGAFLAMAKTYGVEVALFYDRLREAAPEAFETATKSFAFRGKASGTNVKTWVAAETIKLGWRAKRPGLAGVPGSDVNKGFWYDIEKAAILAVERPGSKVNVGPLAFLKRGSFLFMRLPSGGVISYPYPEVREVPYFNDTKQALTFKTVPDPLKPLKILPEADGSINMRWARISTYGGMLAENATQAVARDILANGLTKLDLAGWGITLHVHDEIVAEGNFFGLDLDDFVRVMTDLPPCYDGLPITAAGFQARRYRK